MNETIGYAALNSAEQLKPFKFNRREVGPADVAFDISHCGICHSDLHQLNGDWGSEIYPMVPGHEVVGRVTSVGAKVTKFKPGQLVGVGCMVDSCQDCSSCHENEEQFCEEGATFTYNGEDKHLGGVTYGGYSKKMVVDEAFVLKMPENLDLAASAPLLSAGITTYSPLKRAGIGPHSKVGVVGLGGLGHMAVKIAAAMGAQVVVISRTLAKKTDAMALGATEYLSADDQDALTNAANSFDFILDTVSAQHDINQLFSLPAYALDSTKVTF